MHRSILRSTRRGAVSTSRDAGFSLVELMISIALGLIVLAGVLAIFGQTVRGNKVNLEAARLNQELSSAMQVMVNDVMRSGYTNKVGVTDVFATADVSVPSSSCVLYAYDADQSCTAANSATCIANAERLGFRLTNGVLDMRISGATTTNCNDNNDSWQPLTDSNAVTVTALTFTTTGSKCQNKPASSATVESYWVTTATSGNDALAFPCGANSGITQYLYNTSTKTYAQNGGSFVAPVTGDRTAETRQVNITLTGRVTGDTTVTKTLDASVKLRNDRVRVVP